jgi:PST family polysaccharide transporter
MLYLLTFAKLILPLFTLPYLTRILSKDSYATVSYVKNCMTYVQLIIDFGFILSSVRDIANAEDDLDQIGRITGNTILARLLLSIFSSVIFAFMCASIEVLRKNLTFAVLSLASVVITALLADFLFRGMEKMHFLTVIFVASKGISTVLTFVFVSSDADVLWIPILDTISNSVAVIFTFFAIKRLKIKIRVGKFRDSVIMIKESFVYFLSSIATTAFSALNTLLVGIFMSDELSAVANWSVCLTLISAIQNLYAPICNGIYPYMIREKRLSFIHKILAIFMPIVTLGCVLSFFLARVALTIVGGEEYAEAYPIFRWMIPILFFSFPAQIYGWPTLGAIGRARETTASTMLAAAVQTLGLVFLIATNRFTLISLAMLRSVTEAILMAVRMAMVYKNKKDFIEGGCGA